LEFPAVFGSEAGGLRRSGPGQHPKIPLGSKEIGRGRTRSPTEISGKATVSRIGFRTRNSRYSLKIIVILLIFFENKLILNTRIKLVI
jgi:hypothetical protein